MPWRLLLFIALRRAGRPALLALAAAALALGGVGLNRVAAARCCTLVVTGYDLDTSSANHLDVYAGDRKVAEASAFDGTLVGPERARFVLPPGTYVLYVTNDVRNANYTPSGNPLSVTVTVHLAGDQQIDLRRELLNPRRSEPGLPTGFGRQ